MTSSIWMKIASGRYYSGTAGASRKYVLPVQNWGLQVKDVLTAVVCYGRSSTFVQVKLHLNVAANIDENALFSTTSPVATAATISASLPQTVSGAPLAISYPHFQLVLEVIGSNTAEEYVDGEIYVGGKAAS